MTGGSKVLYKRGLSGSRWNGEDGGGEDDTGRWVLSELLIRKE